MQGRVFEGLRSDDEAAETVFQAGGVEIHQPADMDAAHAEIGEKLGVMGWREGGDGFDFEEDGVFDHDIGAESEGNDFGFVDDGDGDLGLDSEAGFGEFQAQAFFINRFQQSWADGAVDVDGETE